MTAFGVLSKDQVKVAAVIDQETMNSSSRRRKTDEVQQLKDSTPLNSLLKPGINDDLGQFRSEGVHLAV